jgi:hypothetical protein
MDLARAVGQRRHGHFDHDANCATGPFPEASFETRRVEGPADAPAIRFEITKDAKTGEPLYRRVSRT